MNRKSTLLIFFITISIGLSAQFPMGGISKKPSIKGNISGKLIDSISNDVVSYATIVLKKQGREKEINGVLSEENGKFKLTEVPNGKYDLYISFLGYNEKVLDVETTLEKPDINLNDILLVPANYILDEVQITDQRSLIENKVDKLVFNAEQDASISGGDATDVLRKVPLLSVDFDGNVSLRGSSNLRILINGKPSGMFSSNVGDALKMIPANEIKKVEVITTPTAKYDAEGSGGIINIITKKKTADGYSGTLNLSGGNRNSSGNGSLNFAKGRFGINGSGSVFYSNPIDAISDFSRVDTIANLERSLVQDGITNNSRLGFRGSAGAFYDFNAFNSINTNFSTRGFSFISESSQDGELIDPIFGQGYKFLRESGGTNGVNGFDWNMDYVRKFPTKDQELTIALQISGDENHADNFTRQDFLSQDNGNILSVRDEEIFNDGDNLETTLQADYVHPFSNGIKLEIGAKTILRDINSDFRYNVIRDGEPTLDQSRSNIFEYNQDVIAGYASFNFIVAKKYTIITGLRYERTEIEGAFNNGETIESNQYQNFLPNFIISRSLKNFQTLKLSYTQRIQRPSLTFINPFQNSVDSLNIVVGNPNLSPEIVHQVELAYTAFIKGFGIFPSIYYRNTQGIIQNILSIDDTGVGFNTFENVGINNSFGLNIFGSKNVNNFTFRGGGSVSNFNYSSSSPDVLVTNASGFEYRITLGGTVNLPKDFKIDFFGFLQSPRFTIQGQQPSFQIYGIGFKKEFPKIKANFGLRVLQPFNKYLNFNSAQTGDGFSLESSFKLPFRSIGVTFDYRFGNLKFQERKSKIKNTDLLQGGDANQQGAGQQQQGGGGS